MDGFCATGKTTLSRALATLLTRAGRPVIRASADDFQHPPEIRWQLGRSSPEGFYRHAIDVGALSRELLIPLGPGGSRWYRTSTYDIQALAENRSEQNEAPPGSVLLLDGLFLHTSALRSHLDVTLFVTAPFETCVRRGRERNQENRSSADEVEALYRQRYGPGFALYLEEIDPMSLASATIENG